MFFLLDWLYRLLSVYEVSEFDYFWHLERE
jgi:hypothetical protein